MISSIEDVLTWPLSLIFTAVIGVPAGIWLLVEQNKNSKVFWETRTWANVSEAPSLPAWKKYAGNAWYVVFLCGLGLLLVIASSWILPFLTGFIQLIVLAINSLVGGPLSAQDEVIVGLGTTLILVTAIAYLATYEKVSDFREDTRKMLKGTK